MLVPLRCMDIPNVRFVAHKTKTCVHSSGQNVHDPKLEWDVTPGMGCDQTELIWTSVFCVSALTANQVP